VRVCNTLIRYYSITAAQDRTRQDNVALLNTLHVSNLDCKVNDLMKHRGKDSQDWTLCSGWADQYCRPIRGVNTALLIKVLTALTNRLPIHAHRHLGKT
jgi:hypothetical protein